MGNVVNNVAFLPTFKEWAGLYDKWHEQLAKSLWASGSPHDCEEAVHEAFLKVMGLSANLHLQNPLTPKTETCWYGFLRYQAKGILSHRHEYQRRFEELNERCDLERSDSEEDGQKSLLREPIQDVGESTDDARWMEGEVRRIVAAVCEEAGVDAPKFRAFVAFALDDFTGEDVVKAIPEIRNTNNLYSVKNRILQLLKCSSNRFEEVYAELAA